MMFQANKNEVPCKPKWSSKQTKKSFQVNKNEVPRKQKWSSKQRKKSFQVIKNEVPGKQIMRFHLKKHEVPSK